ncbi:MAG: FMN-binding negative transcriptional regulator [Nitrosomonadales bacterium]
MSRHWPYSMARIRISTPTWYATKKETGKVVPTWNYAVVHAYGTLRVVDDPAWVRTPIGSADGSQ